MLGVNGDAFGIILVPFGHVGSFILGSYNTPIEKGIFQTVEMANCFA